MHRAISKPPTAAIKKEVAKALERVQVAELKYHIYCAAIERANAPEDLDELINGESSNGVWYRQIGIPFP